MKHNYLRTKNSDDQNFMHSRQTILCTLAATVEISWARWHLHIRQGIERNDRRYSHILKAFPFIWPAGCLNNSTDGEIYTHCYTFYRLGIHSSYFWDIICRRVNQAMVPGYPLTGDTKKLLRIIVNLLEQILKRRIVLFPKKQKIIILVCQMK